jgi:uncharacterized repeat protein (TIGR03803 family)
MRTRKFVLVVFASALAMLTTSPDAAAQETVLQHFTGANGVAPYAGVVFDSAGNLYGTTIVGGAYENGNVFELMPVAGGGWREKVLYTFTQPNTYAYGGVILDSAGNLYGTTFGGGAFGYGTVYELSPTTGAKWTVTILHNFGNGSDGRQPYSNLIFDTAGNLYGTTVYGGDVHCNGGCGTVFELSPTASGPWTETVLHAFEKNGSDGHYAESNLVFDSSGNLYGTTISGGHSPACGSDGCGAVFELTPAADGGCTETILNSFNNENGSVPHDGLIFDALGNLYGTTFSGGQGDGTIFEIMR